MKLFYHLILVKYVLSTTVTTNTVTPEVDYPITRKRALFGHMDPPGLGSESLVVEDTPNDPLKEDPPAFVASYDPTEAITQESSVAFVQREVKEPVQEAGIDLSQKAYERTSQYSDANDSQEESDHFSQDKFKSVSHSASADDPHEQDAPSMRMLKLSPSKAL